VNHGAFCGYDPSLTIERCGGWHGGEIVMLTLVGENLSRPWNKGLLVGQKKPLQPKHVWSIRVRLEISRKWRDLALFNFAIDSKLRKCDLVNRQYSSGRVVSGPSSQSCLDAAPKKGCNSGAGHAASQTVLCGGWRSSCQGHFVDAQRQSVRLPQIVVCDLAKAERKVGKDVGRGHDLENRQLGYWSQSVRRQVQRRRTGPRAL
jgi:hypothetical protein